MTSSELFNVLKGLASEARVDPQLEASIFIELGDPDPAQWHGRISGGALLLAEEAPPRPDLTVSASSDTAVGLFEKKINPMTALMTGKIKVRGDVAKIMLLKDLLSKKN
ncbi:MAG: SCP2 sterol-binding domain-containing protein [Candidatus Adiutrix sp.]|jgi:putative sterol carrier protein|nr:SCP2 sterol-binding domain-containing protein [Candidatus Adiutrix sp.]